MRFLSALVIFTVSLTSFAASNIRLLESKNHAVNASPVEKQKILDAVAKSFDTSIYREVRVQSVSRQELQVFLFSKLYHSFQLAKVLLDSNLKVLKAEKVDSFDKTTRPFTAKCPDESIEVIAFCPNDNDLELGVTRDVAASARAHGLKTVELLLGDATRENYLNYMACPNLKGNFYDGDSNPEMMVTNDGYIQAEEFKTVLTGAFRYKVTNIWLACEAYNDPMLSHVVKDAQAQKYAAGINDLLVGPSDNAAACAMKTAFDGVAISTAFDQCYKQFDNPEDQWGLGGDGADFFGK